MQFLVVRGKRANARLSAGTSTHLIKSDEKITLCGLDVMCHVNSMTIAASCRKCTKKQREMLAEAGAREAKVTRFTKGANKGTRVCEICKKRTWESRWHQTGMANDGICDDCWDEAGLENEHQDGYYNVDQYGPNEACPMCQEDNLDRKIEQIREQAKLDKQATETAPAILEETKYISRRTSKILFIDDQGEAHYKHQGFERHYLYRVTHIEGGWYWGYRIQADGTRYLGAKGETKMLTSPKIVAESERWRIVEEA